MEQDFTSTPDITNVNAEALEWIGCIKSGPPRRRNAAGTSDLDRQLHERGLAAEIGLLGARSVCAALQRAEMSDE